MPSKEVLDYIKLQRSIGVKDEEIHKALSAAGYEHGEIKVHMDHKAARPVVKQVKTLKLETKHLFFMNLMTVVLVAALFIYMSYDFHTKLNGQAANMNASVRALQGQIAEQSDILGERIIDSKVSVLDELRDAKGTLMSADSTLGSTINRVETESKRRDSTLTASVQAITNRSSRELEKLADQLEVVQKEKVDFSQIVPSALKSVVAVGELGDYGVFQTAGTGAIFNKQGFVVTNFHVIDELKNIMVKTNDQEIYTTTVVGYDELWDIAVLKMDSERVFSQLFWADSDDLYIGQPVIAIGNPAGLEASVTQGIISALVRYIDDSDVPFIQTDVAINRGNSGGPLLDKDGRIVAINTRKVVGNGYEGLGFSVSSNDAKAAVNRILAGQNS